MDMLDRRIFEVLCRNPFAKATEIARELGIPVPTAARRVKKLRERMEVRIEMPKPVEALVFIEGDMKYEAEETFQLNGSNWDYVARVKAGSMEELDRIVSEISLHAKNLSVVLISRRYGKCWRKPEG